MKKNQLIDKFEENQVRSVLKDGHKWFAVPDVISVLTSSKDPDGYWFDMQRREKIELSANCRKFYSMRQNGREYKTDHVNLEGALRLIQSIPSPKAEPFKQWLAKVGYERIEEELSPELAIKRGRQRAASTYARRGYDAEWIMKRIEGIESRGSLTDILKEAQANPKDYAKLTNINHTGTFGVSVKGHKELKQLDKKDSLRDNMVIEELKFNEFSEIILRKKIREEGAQTQEEIDRCVRENAVAMKAARDGYEKATGKRLATPETPSKRDQLIWLGQTKTRT